MILFSLLAFCLSSWFFMGVILLKSAKWYRFLSGWILVAFIFELNLASWYLLGRWQKIIPDSWQLPYYIVTFGGFALINTFAAILLLKRNWHAWAWSKDE